MKFLGVIALLIPLAASAQVVDRFGRAVTCQGAGPVTCAVDGLSVTGLTIDAAMSVISAMPASAAIDVGKPPAPTTIPTLAFMQRLTQAERQTIIVAARSSAAIQDWRDMVLAVAVVDVGDPLTVAGINAMAAAGLLTSARAAQILDLSKASP